MNANDTIIDVAPLEYSSMNASAKGAARGYANGAPAGGYRDPAWGRSSTWQDSPHGSSQTRFDGASPYGRASASCERTSKSPFSALGGLTQVVLGAGLVAIGIPLLILPGPGMLTMGAGTLLIAHGLSKMHP